MKKVKNFLQDLNLNISFIELDSQKRRHIVTEEMQNLKTNSINCYGCTGKCCTFIANSMQITPLEAIEILFSLSDESYEQVIHNLNQTIQTFRLDNEISIGKRGNFRKTYTCPFYNEGPKGCGIKKELKPYGCLAFNPVIENDNGAQCRSSTQTLENREKSFFDFENSLNLKIKNKLNITWDKKDIPSALIEILKKN